MPEKKKEYKRLPGKKKDFFSGYHTLWMGPDHLLSVCYRFGCENYNRFYYKDIQVIFIKKSVEGKIINGILGALVGFFLFEGVYLDGDLSTLFWLLAVLTIGFILINLVFGPTCQCRIQTAVHQKKLRSLHRYKTAVKALRLLTPTVERAQGKLTSEALGKFADTSPQTDSSARSKRRPDEGFDPPTVRKP